MRKRKLLFTLYAVLYFLLFVIFYLLGRFAYELQENFYTGPNALYGIEKFLRFQTSLTSLFYPFEVIFMGLSVICYVGSFLKNPPIYSLKGAMIGLIIGVAVAGTIHEIQQSLNPPYPDNNLLDWILSMLACGTVLFHVLHRRFSS